MPGIKTGIGRRIGIHHGALLNQIPFKSDALVWLDGTISVDNFVDKISGKLFPITGKDFDASWTRGFPYKSAATISAPVGDATLIAADLNNYWYTAGVPNQIPVISLFQDIDYEHKFFCRHIPQMVDTNGAEMFEPRVADIVIYNTVKSGADLVNCNVKFSVPVEDVATMAWVSTTGNDTTGTGTKANPYLTINKIKATTKANIYIRSGSYNPTAAMAFDGVALNIIGVGKVQITLPAISIGLTLNRPIKFKGCSINSNNTTTYAALAKSKVEFESCILTKTNSLTFVETNPGVTDISFKYCVCNTGNFSLIKNYTVFNDFTIDTCFGTLKVDIRIANVINKNTITNNKITEGFIQTCGLSTLKSVGNIITSNTVNSVPFMFKTVANANISDATFISNVITGAMDTLYVAHIGTDTEPGTNGINGLICKNNKIVNTYIGTADAAHTLFIGGGINNIAKYNDITVTNGYGIVVKSGGGHYTVGGAHVAYNIVRYAAAGRQSIYDRGSFGLVVANNTIINYLGSLLPYALYTDDNGTGQDNSMLCINNVVSLAGNATALSGGVNMTSRNNIINKNGFALTNPIGANDLETTIQIDANGVPASRFNEGEVMAGDNIGLAYNYSIPNAITYKNQDANWQKGAIILT